MQPTSDNKPKGQVVYGSPFEESPSTGGAFGNTQYGQPLQQQPQFGQPFGQPMQQPYGKPQDPMGGYGSHYADYGKPYQPNSSTNASVNNNYSAAGGYTPQSYPGGGGPGIPVEDDIETDNSKFFTHDTDVAIRHGFIRKVYGILSVQLAISFGIMALFALLPGPKKFLIEHSFLIYVSFGVSIGLLLAIVCCGLSRKVPLNYVLICVFSISEGIFLAFCAMTVSVIGLLTAVGVTAFVVLVLSLFACQTKYDFTGCSTFVLASSVALIVLSIVGLIFRDRIFHVVISGIVCLVMCFYIIYDTQQIVGGKGRQYEISIDDYVLGALTLYLDIVTLFLHLLSIIRFAENN